MEYLERYMRYINNHIEINILKTEFYIAGIFVNDYNRIESNGASKFTRDLSNIVYYKFLN